MSIYEAISLLMISNKKNSVILNLILDNDWNREKAFFNTVLFQMIAEPTEFTRVLNQI
jgi:hypothetical protein